MATDIFYKKTLTYKYGGRELQFRVSQDLFSSFQVDLGTQFIIRVLTLGQPFPFRKILDLGCGYGPIGITLKALYPDAEVHMVDKDALAVDYARQNVELNHLSPVQVYPSLGYENLTANDYDLIVSNIPAKAGEPVIRHLLDYAVYHMQPGGNVAVVVVKTLAEEIRNLLSGNTNIEIIQEKSRPGHTVFQYRFKQNAAGIKPEGVDVYSRGFQDFPAENPVYRIEGVYGLEEDAGLNYTTTLVQEVIYSHPPRPLLSYLVFNPGVGHVPVFISQGFKPSRITLVDRDLLALEYSKRNLILNGYAETNVDTVFQPGFAPADGKNYDLIAGFLREEESPAPVAFTTKQLAGALAVHGTLILAGTSTGITRVAETLAHDVRLKEVNRRKYRGFSVIVYKQGNIESNAPVILPPFHQPLI